MSKKVFKAENDYSKDKNKKVLTRADILKRISKGLKKADIEKMNMK